MCKIPKTRRAQAGTNADFGDAGMRRTREGRGLNLIFVARLTQEVPWLCRHGDEHWQKTGVAKKN
jgi:hypothetical protein